MKNTMTQARDRAGRKRAPALRLSFRRAGATEMNAKVCQHSAGLENSMDEATICPVALDISHRQRPGATSMMERDMVTFLVFCASLTAKFCREREMPKVGRANDSPGPFLLEAMTDVKSSI
jgi:hypothetical protein